MPTKHLFLITLALATIATPAQERQRPNVRDKNFELGAFTGASVGFDRIRPMAGGNVTYAVNKWLLPYFELSAFPGLERNSPVLLNNKAVDGYSQRTSVTLFDYNGGVHIRRKLGQSNIVPYAVLGFGGIRRPASTVRLVNAKGIEERPAGFPTTVATAVPFPGRGSSAINFGAGIRWYIRENFGLRVEAKGYRTFQFSENDPFGRITFGVFYQTR